MKVEKWKSILYKEQRLNAKDTKLPHKNIYINIL